MIVENSGENAFYFEDLKSALRICLISLGDRLGFYEVNNHIKRLQGKGSHMVKLTIQGLGLADPDIVIYEFPITHENIR